MAISITWEVQLSSNGAFEPSAFDAGAFIDETVWTDFTPDRTVAPIRITRVFQSSDPDDLVMAPAMIQFELNNSDTNNAGKIGYYSPDHANCCVGWGVGNVFRLTITANGNSRVRFYGYVDSIRPEPGLFGTKVCAVTAVSWLGIAQTASINGLTSVTNKRADELLTSLLTTVGKQPPATQFATGLDTYPYAFDDLNPNKSTAIDACDSIAKSGFDRIYEKGDGTLVLETRQTREGAATPLLAITDAGTGSYPSLAIIEGGMPVKRDRANLLNQFRVTVRPRRIDASAVVLYSLPVSGTSPYVDPGVTVSFDAMFVDPNQPIQGIGAFNTLISNGSGGSMVGTSGSLPAADFAFGSTAGGGGTNLTSSMVVTVVYKTSQATFTVTNNGTVRAYYGLLQCRGQGIYGYQATVGTASNSNSQSAISQTVRSIDCPYQPDSQFAQNAANWCAAVFAGDRSQLETGIKLFVPADEEATIDLLLSRDISDPISVSESVTGLSVSRFWINGEILEIDERNNVTFTYPLQPMALGLIWSLGIAGASELGTTTYLGYF